ncbi:hypothetical protein [Microbacterium sp. NPDC076895]|jgi:hypothetical protein|uniref:hypothetical protein n=1 Tax=Microbacterium sp. NPDC076895 TaxID=3154957 RepID=UPI00342CA1AA
MAWGRSKRATLQKQLAEQRAAESRARLKDREEGLVQELSRYANFTERLAYLERHGYTDKVPWTSYEHILQRAEYAAEERERDRERARKRRREQAQAAEDDWNGSREGWRPLYDAPPPGPWD